MHIFAIKKDKKLTKKVSTKFIHIGYKIDSRRNIIIGALSYTNVDMRRDKIFKKMLSVFFVLLP